jgi:hypothetical protein
MIEDYEDLIKSVRTLVKDNNESVCEVDGEKLPPCGLMTSKLAALASDKPQFGENEWKKFWAVCKEHFPIHSVCGTAHSVEAVEFFEREQVKNCMLDILENRCIVNNRVFEIGYGYGGFGKEIMRKDTWNADYYGIDYVASNKSLLSFKKNGKKRFYEINVSGIPQKFRKQKFGLIYSRNVFQHLTKAQKQGYFNDVAEMMNDNSVFYFTVFEWNYKKNDTPREDYNTKFFGVKTNIESPDELNAMLLEANLRIIDKTVEHYGTNRGETNSVRYICKLRK